MAVGEEEDLNDIDDEEQREEKQLEWGKGGFKGQTEEKRKGIPEAERQDDGTEVKVTIWKIRSS